jgi:hypothetical protein
MTEHRGVNGHRDGPDGADEALLGELAALLAAQGEPPPEVLHAARESFVWRTVDAEIAALTYDSLLDDEPAATRAAARSRVLAFEADGLTIEVELDSTPSGRRLLGQLVPAQEAEVELRAGETVVATAAADELGRFAMALPARPQRVVVRCRVRGARGVESALSRGVESALSRSVESAPTVI